MILAFMVTVTMPETVSAQSVETRIDRVEKQLRAVQREVFRSGGVPDSDGSIPSGGQLAGIEVRIQQLESQIRALNGQIEEMRFQMEESDRRMEKFQEDAEFRFGELEQGRSGRRERDEQSGDAEDTESDVRDDGEDESDVLENDGGNDVSGDTEGSDGAGNSGGGNLPEGSVMEQYNHAFRLLAQGDYEGGERAFREFLSRHGDDDLAGDAQYWLAQSFFVRGNNERAAREFLTGFQDYPNSQKAPAYLLKIGLSLTRIGQKQDACAVLDELAARHPDSPEARQNLADARKDAECE